MNTANQHKQNGKLSSATTVQNQSLLLPFKTGRTHQLRIHSAHHNGMNMPIVGDDLYGQKAERLHLHAQYLGLAHPVTGEPMIFEVDADF